MVRVSSPTDFLRQCIVSPVVFVCVCVVCVACVRACVRAWVVCVCVCLSVCVCVCVSVLCATGIHVFPFLSLLFIGSSHRATFC